MASTHSGFSTARKIATAGVAALALGAGTLAATAPAEAAFGGHGGGAMFRPGGGFGHGGFGRGGFGRGGFGYGRDGYGRGFGYGLAGFGLGLAAGGLYGAYGWPGYAYADGYGCLRTVATPYGYRTVDVCE